MKLENLFDKENEYLMIILNRYPRNYYLWMYKYNILKEFAISIFCLNNNNCIESIRKIINKSSSEIKEYLQKNVHEFSAFHFLYLLNKLYMQYFGNSFIEEYKAWA